MRTRRTCSCRCPSPWSDASSACLVGRGALDPGSLVTAYVPELEISGYSGATIRNLLDMRSGVKFSEDYTDLDSEVRIIEQAWGWRPAAHGLASRLDVRIPDHTGCRPRARWPLFRTGRVRPTFSAGSASAPQESGWPLCCPSSYGLPWGPSSTPR